MDLLILKLTITPLLFAGATLAVRRWGFRVGGWVAGLPLTTCPVSVFLALEQGSAFAVRAAVGNLLGLIAFAAYCFGYSRGARIWKWPAALLCGLSLWFVTLWGSSFVHTDLSGSALLALAVLFASLAAMGPSVPASLTVNTAWWDIPLRIGAGTAMVLLITGCAEYLGPDWSGLLTPFPALTCVMAVFSHKQSGPAAAHNLLRGVVVGSFSAAFFLVAVGLTLESTHIAVSYILASGVALAVNGVSLAVLIRQKGEKHSPVY